MNRLRLLLPLMLGLLAPSCAENTAPGNDREAELDPPEPPAEVAGAGAVLAGVATTLLVPQTMTQADLRNVPEGADRCVFRMTRVGLPVLAYGSAAALKLNDRLVALAPAGDGRYAAGGVTVTVRPLEEDTAEEDAAEEELFAAEMILRLREAPNELGFHGFSECGASE